VLLGALAAAAWARRITRPIRLLARTASKLVAGESVEMHPSRVSEVDEVARAIQTASHSRREVEERNAHLLAETERRRRTGESLAEITRLISQSLDAERVGTTIVDAVSLLFHAPAAVLYRLEPDSRELVRIAGVGLRDWSERLGRGVGANGLAVSQRQLVMSADILTDPRIAITPEVRVGLEDSPYRAVLAVPLMVQDRVIGTLGIGDHVGRVFDAEETRIAQAFAQQAAVAIENARLHGEIQDRLNQSETLLTVGQQVSGTLDVTEMMRRVAREVGRALGADMVGAYLADADHACLRPIAGYHVSKHLLADFMAFPIPLKGHPLLEEAWKELRAVASADVATDPRVDREILRRFPQRSSLFCPMIVQDMPIGGFFVTWFEHEHCFRPTELRLLEGISRQAGIALANARLVEELKTRQARLEVLLELSNQVSRIQPVTPLLTAIAEACGHLLGTDSVGIRLVEGDDLVLAGAYGDATQGMSRPRLKIGESFSGRVAASGEPLQITDPENDSRVIPEHRPLLRGMGYRAWLGVPIKAGERTLGVLSIRTKRPEGFSTEDLVMITAFAGQAAIALENSRLFQETQRALEELSHTQQQLTQAQKMEVIGQLAGGIAHDFNNLLTVIGGRSQLLLGRLHSDDAARRDVELIWKTSDRAAALTRQLLAFSRKQVLLPKPLDLNALVGGLVPMLTRLIGEHIELVIVPGKGLGWVMADPGQLEQAIMNLLVNARDAMPDGGMVRIETQSRHLQEVTLHAQGQIPPGQYVALSVHDTGCGMDPTTLTRIFEPFFTTKEVGKGTGLGLSSVYGIVQQSAGYIGVDSAVGRGTTFTVYLTRTAPPSETPEAQGSAAALVGGQETILLVEDDEGVRKLASEVLNACGYTVLETGDPLEALVIGEHHRGPMHLLVTDMVMPALRGPALAVQVLARHPNMRVLYMSGYTDEMIGRRTVTPGGLFLQKPFTPDTLARTVREALAAVSSDSSRRETTHNASVAIVP
jgi:GAF domain-containing protein/CheY-like chemotaxis protein